MFGLSQTASRIVSLVALACVLVVILLTFAWCNADRAAKLAHANQRIAEGQAKASDAATGAVADYGDRQAERVETDRKNRDDILSASNANDPAGDAGDIGLRRLCDRAINRADPVCVRLKSPPAAK